MPPAGLGGRNEMVETTDSLGTCAHHADGEGGWRRKSIGRNVRRYSPSEKYVVLSAIRTPRWRLAVVELGEARAKLSGGFQGYSRELQRSIAVLPAGFGGEPDGTGVRSLRRLAQGSGKTAVGACGGRRHFEDGRSGQGFRPESTRLLSSFSRRYEQKWLYRHPREDAGGFTRRKCHSQRALGV